MCSNFRKGRITAKDKNRQKIEFLNGDFFPKADLGNCSLTLLMFFGSSQTFYPKGPFPTDLVSSYGLAKIVLEEIDLRFNQGELLQFSEGDHVTLTFSCREGFSALQMVGPGRSGPIARDIHIHMHRVFKN